MTKKEKNKLLHFIYRKLPWLYPGDERSHLLFFFFLFFIILKNKNKSMWIKDKDIFRLDFYDIVVEIKQANM